jgi:hypothetical protein
MARRADGVETPFERSPLSRLPLPVVDAMEVYFENNPSLGDGDLRAEVTLEMLNRAETTDTWTVCNRKLGRAQVMELLLDQVAAGYSIPALLRITGMPRPRTYMRWVTDYRVFREMMEVAEQMQAMVHVDDALEIVDAIDPDGKQAFRDKMRSDLRMRMAEIFNPRKYGKKQMVDVTHHADIDPEEQWSRFSSILTTHAQMIEAKTGIKIIFPERPLEMQTIDVTPEPEPDVKTLGMEGENIPEDEWNSDLRW